MVYEDIHIHPSEAIEKALSLHATYTSHDSTWCSRLTIAWQPPPERYLKLNVDGTVFVNLQLIGVGFILRYSKGNVLWLQALEIPMCPIRLQQPPQFLGLWVFLTYSLTVTGML